MARPFSGAHPFCRNALQCGQGLSGIHCQLFLSQREPTVCGGTSCQEKEGQDSYSDYVVHLYKKQK